MNGFIFANRFTVQYCLFSEQKLTHALRTYRYGKVRGLRSNSFKGIGTQTIVCSFYDSLHVAEQFATNFMKINQGIRKL